jgi:UDP-glucose 4-epimerase
VNDAILITGGAGFIGSHLAERLVAEGKKVIVIDDLSTGSEDNLRAVMGNPRLQFIRSTVSSCPNLAGLVAGTEMVYHLAATVGVELVIKKPIETLENNLDETEAILEAASRCGVPLLLASTSEVYGKSNRPAFAETDDLLIGPSNLGRWRYACSKLTDEFLAFAYTEERRLPIVVARLFNTVGPRQTGRYGMVLPRFISAALKGAPLEVFGNGTQTRCFCYVSDTVEALARLRNCSGARGQIFNIGSNEEVSIQRLAERVRDLLHSKSAIVQVPYDQAYAPGFEDMLRRKPVIDKLERITGFRPRTTLDEIILKTASSIAERAGEFSFKAQDA